MIKKFFFWAVASLGEGLSGSDRIYIELARRWSKSTNIDIYVWEEGLKMCRRQHLENPNIKFQILKLERWCRFGFIVCYFARIVASILEAVKIRLPKPSDVLIYSASEFWMDSLPCVILKLRYPEVTWVATWYQTAPNPIEGYKEQGIRKRKYFTSALLYWLTQVPIKPLISKFADKVIVNNEDEKSRFPEHTKNGDTIVLIGAVPLEEIQKFLATSSQLPATKKYDAVFQGRFHPQKGVIELIDIWKEVVKKKPDAKLAMIGDGPLMGDVVSSIARHGLRDNVNLFGYVYDGPKKYSIFHASKIVVHPAFFDSGGMASAEAMAFGLPAVGFNLKAYESYYPQGMLKVKNEEQFATTILNLLTDSKKREKIGKQAQELIWKDYSWDNRAQEIYRKVMQTSRIPPLSGG